MKLGNRYLKTEIIGRYLYTLTLWLLTIATSFGQFGPQHTIASNTGNAPRGVVITDVTGDGINDVIIASYSSGFSGYILLYKNLDGQGNFSDPIQLASYTGAQHVQHADLDDDGDQDLILSSGSEVGFRVLFNVDGEGDYSEFRNVSIGGYGQVADIDSDGDLDLIGSGQRFARNLDGDGDFGDYTSYTEQNIDGRLFNSFCLGDLDGDSDIDIVVSRYSWGVDTAFLYWLPNLDGQGTFGDEILLGTRHAIQPSYVFHALHTADLDEDGHIDLIAGDANNRELSVYFNNGNAESFGERVLVDDYANYPVAIHTHDIDYDGDLDIIYGMINQTASWCLNNGDRTFEIGSDLELSSNGCRAISLGDLSGDGFFDIATVCHSTSTDGIVAWNENFFRKPRIAGYVFLDENQNGIYDENEIAIDQHVNLLPGFLASYDSEFGKFHFVADTGDYILQCIPNENWQGTSPLTRDISIQDVQLTIEENFGLVPIGNTSDLEVNLSSSPTRCGFEVAFWLDYKNVGNQFDSGFVTLELDELVTLVAVTPLPDLVSGNNLQWNFDNLPPTHSNQIELRLQMPGVENLGEFLSFSTEAIMVSDTGEETVLATYEYDPQINCAYDPNDKLVNPNVQENGNPTPIGTKLEYTVRFQNTGTDTAFTVRIEDQLDSHLDWNTFQPLASSHSYSATLDDAGKVTFLFSNIELPDSTTNEPASHGFIKYQINHLSGIIENTEILNSADIFFDYNSPILTNSTINTMIAASSTTEENSANLNMNVFPNPTNGNLNITLRNENNNEVIIEVYNSLGKIMRHYNSQYEDGINLDLTNLPKGMYFIRLRLMDQFGIEKIIIE